MGRPKLLLPLGSSTVIAHFLDAVAISEISQTVIVMRRGDTNLQQELNRLVSARDHKVAVVRPEVDPPEMRASLAYAFKHLAREWRPERFDACLISPADHPTLDRDLIAMLARKWQQTQASVLIPSYRGRRGHPVLISWELATRLGEIPEGQGLNWLVRQSPAQEVPVDSAEILADLDTPEDYAALQQRWGQSGDRTLP